MFNMFKKQFIDVIDWTEDDEDVLAYRYPVMDMEIQTGAQLTVRESRWLFSSMKAIWQMFSALVGTNSPPKPSLFSPPF